MWVLGAFGVPGKIPGVFPGSLGEDSRHRMVDDRPPGEPRFVAVPTAEALNPVLAIVRTP